MKRRKIGLGANAVVFTIDGRLAMRKFAIVGTACAATLLLPSAAPIMAQSDSDQQLGNVHFETSCNEVAQRRFDRAMGYQHSFWYNAAKEIFEEAAKADPECGIA